MEIDGSSEELPVIERLLEELKTAQVKHLERRFKNVSDACQRMELRIARARILLTNSTEADCTKEFVDKLVDALLVDEPS